MSGSENNNKSHRSLRQFLHIRSHQTGDSSSSPQQQQRPEYIPAPLAPGEAQQLAQQHARLTADSRWNATYAQQGHAQSSYGMDAPVQYGYGPAAGGRSDGELFRQLWNTNQQDRIYNERTANMIPEMTGQHHTVQQSNYFSPDQIGSQPSYGNSFGPAVEVQARMPGSTASVLKSSDAGVHTRINEIVSMANELHLKRHLMTRADFDTLNAKVQRWPAPDEHNLLPQLEVDVNKEYNKLARLWNKHLTPPRPLIALG